MSYTELELENEREIDSVSSFIRKIKELKDSSDGTSTELYFRGQEVDFWDVQPSIFRNDMLSIEHKLMQVPLQKNPKEFKELDSTFDIMTKYQHYGMCTRLLDLTTNPLVALYFACKLNKNDKYGYYSSEEDKEPDGIVYYTDFYYPSQSTDKEVRIVSALAGYDLQRENTIGQILSRLETDEVIDNTTKEKWLKEDCINEFIDIIQKNYMVIPAYSNERLKRQNGVFLLASMFSVDIKDNIKDGIVTKCKSDLRNEFSENYFLIKGDKKEEILKELDLYNINEATLFPELEHQLNHIKTSNSNCTQAVSDFSKYEKQVEKTSQFVCVNDELLNKHIISTLQEKLKQIVDEDDFESIKKIIEENLVVDWYRRESTSSKIKMDIISYYMRNGRIGTVNAKNISANILVFLNEETKKYIFNKK